MRSVFTYFLSVEGEYAARILLSCKSEYPQSQFSSPDIDRDPDQTLIIIVRMVNDLAVGEQIESGNQRRRRSENFPLQPVIRHNIQIRMFQVGIEDQPDFSDTFLC